MNPIIIAAIITGVCTLIAAFFQFFKSKKDTKDHTILKNPPLDPKPSSGEILSVAVAIVKDHAHILMVRRRAPEGKLRWQFPAGIVKPGQDSENVVIAEVYKETGISCCIIHYLGSRLHSETKVICQYFACEYLDGKAANLDQAENAEVRWVSAEKVNQFVTSSIDRNVKKFIEKDIINAEIANVVVGIILYKGKVLMVQQATSNLWWFPGGTIEPGESEEEAIMREVLEETGVKCIHTKSLGQRIHPESKQKISYHRCRYLEGEPHLKEPQNFKDVKWLQVEDSINLIGNKLFEPVHEILVKESLNKNEDS